MLRISQRATIFPDSPIRKLSPYADLARAAGRTVYSLNIGQPDIPTPRPFLDALKAYDKTVIAYGNSQGELSYREALTGYYQGCGIDLVDVVAFGSHILPVQNLSTCPPAHRQSPHFSAWSRSCPAPRRRVPGG